MSTSLSEPRARPVPPRTMRLRGASAGIWPALSILAGLLLWQLVSLGFSDFILPPPTAVLQRLGDPAYLAELGAALAASLGTMLAGFAIAFAVAVPLGTVMGRSPRLAAAVEPVLTAFYAIPPVALVPFVVIWFGLFVEGRIALIVLMSLPDILVVTLAGARDIPPRLIAVGRSFGASPAQMLRRVLLPASLPFLFAAMRVGLARAITGMITAELFLAAAALGGMMKTSAEAFDNAGVFVIVVLVCLLGLAVQSGVRRLERRMLHWHMEENR
ncbi:ABC transporter permease [Roseomonas sp. E05]|uniref:ABC transporter permease n=1 Tax=Roseomonas sp. E05 TaxID=3046310 RepID=UPI0024B9CC0F|nr:ABC transporter permease [Roseomonas sp. E05]MDJ0391242.1 ABC transporter permease [Roseomonas sp. E05]